MATNSATSFNHVYLKNNPLLLLSDAPASPQTQFFFDPCNLQIVRIDSTDSNRLVITKIYIISRKTESITLNVPGFQLKGSILAAKFSLDEKYLAIQHHNSQMDCIYLQDNSIFTQVIKKASSNLLLGFFWTSSDNLLFITSNGVELYQFPPASKKKELKLLKEQKLAVNWFIYSAKHRVLLLSVGGPLGTLIQGYHFTPNNILKIPKFTVEKEKSPLKQTELVVTQIYGKLFCIHINAQKQELALYQLTKEVVMKRASVSIHTSGQVAVQVVDNLLVVHNIDSKVVLIYDIKSSDTDFPVAAPLPLAPFFLDGKEVELYRKQWTFLQPNLILDTSEGLLWETDINLQAIALCFPDKKKLVDFLMKRPNARQLLLQVLRNIIEECESISIISEIFDMLNHVLSQADPNQTASPLVRAKRGTPPNNSPPPTKSELTSSTGTPEDWATQSLATLPSASELEGSSSSPAHSNVKAKGYVVIDQHDMYTHVFSRVEEEGKGLDYKYMVAVVVEYIRSLNFHHRTVEPYLNELLINFLVRNNRFYQLHQLLQYHVVSDSVHVACQLLSLEATYPPAYQLALDMFKRLHTHDQIIEVLLTKNQIVPAIRFMRSLQQQSKKPAAIPAARFLQAAQDTGNKTLLYTVYRFFEDRNEITPELLKYAQVLKPNTN